MTQRTDKPVIIATIVDEGVETLSDLDEKNPRSFFNLLPFTMKEYARRVPVRYFELTEEELKTELFGEAEVDAVVTRLRHSLWDEYDRVQRYNEPKIVIDRVVLGICPERLFWKRVIPDKARLAWILRAPMSYEVNLREIHTLGMRALKAAIAVSPLDCKGRPNVKLIETQFKIMQHIDMRIKGAIIQRIDQRNMSVTLSGELPPPKPGQQLLEKPTVDEVNKQIAELQDKSAKLQVPTNVKVDLMKDSVRRNAMITHAAGEVLSVSRERPDEAGE